MVNHPHRAKPKTKRECLLRAMASAAKAAYWTAQAFGVDSPEHVASLVAYGVAKAHYEAEGGLPVVAAYVARRLTEDQSNTGAE